MKDKAEIISILDLVRSRAVNDQRIVDATLVSAVMDMLQQEQPKRGRKPKVSADAPIPFATTDLAPPKRRGRPPKVRLAPDMQAESFVDAGGYPPPAAE